MRRILLLYIIFSVIGLTTVHTQFDNGRQRVDENGYDQYGNQVDPAMIPDRLDSANVEVHGGASMEEVAVPIIEITQKTSNIEAFIVDESRVLTLGAKEYAIIKIYVGIRSNNISIKLDGNYYNAEETAEPYIYSVELKNYSKKGKFAIDILDGGSVLASGQQFEIEKKGMSQNDMFDF